MLNGDNTDGGGLNEVSSFSRLEFPVQENLILADFSMRNYVTGEKHEVYIGDYSVERLYERRLEKVERMIMPIFNTTTEEYCSNRYSAFEGGDCFANEMVDDDEDDDWIKTKPLKKKRKHAQERVA